MDLYILNTNYELIAVIDQAESKLWDKKYNDTGNCEIYTSCSTEILNYLQMDYYIFRYDDDMVCKIVDRTINTSVENGDYLTVIGTDICDILSGRYVLTNINFTGTVFNLIKRMLEENVMASGNRQMLRFTFDNSNSAQFTDEITIQLTYQNEVLATIKELCQAYDYGFRLTYDIATGNLVFKLYQGEDKSSTTNEEYVEFSNEYGNILNTSYKENKQGYKTVAIVGGVEAEDGSRLFVEVERVGSTSGINRQELFVDGSSIKKNMTIEEVEELYPGGAVSGTQYIVSGNVIANKDTSGDNYTLVDTYYEPLLIAHGQAILTQYNKSYSFEGGIDAVGSYIYKEDYNLGDKVKFINNYGISASARITEVLESEDENGYDVEPKFNYEEVDD